MCPSAHVSQLSAEKYGKITFIVPFHPLDAGGMDFCLLAMRLHEVAQLELGSQALEL